MAKSKGYEPSVPLQMEEGLESLTDEQRNKLLAAYCNKATAKLVTNRLLKGTPSENTRGFKRPNSDSEP